MLLLNQLEVITEHLIVHVFLDFCEVHEGRNPEGLGGSVQDTVVLLVDRLKPPFALVLVLVQSLNAQSNGSLTVLAKHEPSGTRTIKVPLFQLITLHFTLIANNLHIFIQCCRGLLTQVHELLGALRHLHGLLHQPRRVHVTHHFALLGQVHGHLGVILGAHRVVDSRFDA